MVLEITGKTSSGVFSPSQTGSKAGPKVPLMISPQLAMKGWKWEDLGISNRMALWAGPGAFRKTSELARLIRAGWIMPVPASRVRVSTLVSSLITFQASALLVQELD